MRPRLIIRAPGTRAARVDTRQRRIESLAAEFALLAQRRARVVHQMDLLDQQREAAAIGFNKLQVRMAWLAQKMHALDPDLHETDTPAEVAAPPPPPPPPPVAHTPSRPVKPAALNGAARHAGGKLAAGAINRTLKNGRLARGLGANKWRT
jgi:hypothetical protein